MLELQEDGAFWISVTLAFDDSPGSLGLTLEDPSWVAGFFAVVSCSGDVLVSAVALDLDGSFTRGGFPGGGFCLVDEVEFVFSKGGSR